MAERNIRLDIQYKGTDFAGWQFQPDAVTVQGEIEKAIEKITGKEVRLVGAGRTDAGVHALGQAANFIIDHNLEPDRYKDAINHFLPKTILIVLSSEVDKDFNARFQAKSRFYRYIISREKSALYFNYRWETNYKLNLELLNKMAALLHGKHDFNTFCVVSSLKENNECEIYSAEWKKHGSQIIFEIKANRFLHSMVRSLVGLMVQLCRENDDLTLNKFEDIMKSGDHTRIKLVAPARGLYLVKVSY